MIRAARGKLLSLGLAEWQIDAVVNAGKSSRRFAVVAPHRGYLVEKDVVEGAHIQANSRLFRIVPLDRVWIDADVYVRDLPLVARGQTVTASVPSWAGDHARTGTIDFVYPEVEAKTQTGRVRVVLGNKDGSLLPGMYVDVDVEVPLPEALTVPVDAVLYSGEHRLVFKDLGEGRLTPVPIVIGDRSGDRVVVRSGLSEGEVVVTSGAFLIAAESRLKSAAPYWGGRLDHAGETTVGGGHGAH